MKLVTSMKKKEIFEILKQIPVDSKNYIVVGDAALVCYGVLKETDLVELESLVDFSFPNCKIQKVSSLPELEEMNGFFFLSLKKLERMKKEENHNSDKSILKKIELLLDMRDTTKYEKELRKQGITLIGGVDEVGRGPLVGPVVAACCILPEKFSLEGLTDSKKLSEKKRDYFFEEIKKQAISYGIGIVDEKRIDEINIYEASKEAMKKAIRACDIQPEHVLSDAMKLDIDIPVTPIIKGDLRSITISAASVLAKVTRDRMMMELDEKYPMYDFKHNVGYPTKKHLDAISKYGILEEHRKSYGPVKEYLERKKKD